MSENSRLPAVIAYLPIIGWAYVFFLQRQNILAMYHLRQSVGLALFLVGILLGWGAVAWVLAWIPYMGAISAALFSIVIAAYFVGCVAWIMGLFNAVKRQLVPLPVFGRWAEKLR